jgi:hypothetical protein
MSILGKIKDQISRIGQRALGIDGVRYDLQVALERLERLNQIQSKLVELESKTAQTSDQLQNLRSFLTWYSNRVEPWYWTGNFALSDPEEELAGLLVNFLPGRVLVNVGPETSDFAKAAAQVGYEVHHLELPNSDTLPGAMTSLDRIDFLNVTRENVDAGLAKALKSIQAAVIQMEFADEIRLPAQDRVLQKAPVSTPEIIKELGKQGYYWNVIIFRTEVESFIRMGTNLASVPGKAWGKIVFFRDHQLFLKAFHWCKTTLPRYRAARLAT